MVAPPATEPTSSGAGPFSSGWRLGVLAAGLGGLYALGALLPFWYLSSPEAGAAFFPPAGLTLAMLALSPRRTWPLWLAVVAAAELAVDLTHGQSVGMALGFAAANVVEPFVGASALRWGANASRRLTLRQSLAAYVLCAAALGPAVGAMVGATTAALGGDAAWFTTFGKWWLGDALGVLVVATPILAWARRARFDVECSLTEAIVITLVATAVTIVPAVLWEHPMLYTVLPVLVWAALRGGMRAVTLAGVGVAFAADYAAVTGRASDLIAGGTSAEQLVYVQLFIGVTLLAAMVLAVEVAERRRAEYEGRLADADRLRAEAVAAEAADEERRRIARETHDIVGHALNVMLLQAGAARRVMPSDSEKSRELIESLESVGRDAFRDLDVALGITDEPPDALVGRGLSTVPALIGVMRQAGISVDCVVEGEGGGAVSTLVDWSAFRIIQEAMTNVTKHAPGAHTEVRICYEPTALVISVVDDGGVGPSNGHKNGTGTGRGIVGMRERVAILGGDIDVGPNAGSGFAVRARIPTLANT